MRTLTDREALLQAAAQGDLGAQNLLGWVQASVAVATAQGDLKAALVPPDDERSKRAAALVGEIGQATILLASGQATVESAQARLTAAKAELAGMEREDAERIASLQTVLAAARSEEARTSGKLRGGSK
jgi:hypothetical protein